MSAGVYIFSRPRPPSHLFHWRAVKKGAALNPLRLSWSVFSNGGGFSEPSPTHLFLKTSPNGRKRGSIFFPIRPFSPVMEWQDCSVSKEIDAPCSVAYACYSDRESIPKWMPFISSVKVLEDKPELSRWSLKYEVFGRDVEYSWLARNMQPIPNQKIHWRSLEGLPNKGAVRFFPKGPSACRVELSISYEIPQILAPVASALKPFMEGLLLDGLERFADVVKEYQKNPTRR